MGGNFRTANNVVVVPCARPPSGPDIARAHVHSAGYFRTSILPHRARDHCSCPVSQLCGTAAHAQPPSSVHRVLRLSGGPARSTYSQTPGLALAHAVLTALRGHGLRPAPNLSRQFSPRTTRNRTPERLGRSVSLGS